MITQKYFTNKKPKTCGDVAGCCDGKGMRAVMEPSCRKLDGYGPTLISYVCLALVPFLSLGAVTWMMAQTSADPSTTICLGIACCLLLSVVRYAYDLRATLPGTPNYPTPVVKLGRGVTTTSENNGIMGWLNAVPR